MSLIANVKSNSNSLAFDTTLRAYGTTDSFDATIVFSILYEVLIRATAKYH